MLLRTEECLCNMKAGKNYKVNHNSENETFCTLNNIPTHHGALTTELFLKKGVIVLL